MSNLPPDDTDLEQRIHVLLRDLPGRRAPATLAARVTAAIEHRPLPWWQRGFAAWPLAARLAFLVTSVSLGWLAVAGAPSLTAVLRPVIGWLPWVTRLGRTAAETAAAVLQAIPVHWLEGAAAFTAFLYLATFALGATAYRALYSKP
jgi:hypothetical protein